MKAHYQMFAAYNQWANAALYDAASALTVEEFNTDTGAFFGSVCRTLNHLLVADRVWLHRFSGEGPQPTALNELLHADFAGLHAARVAEDQRIIGFVDGLTEERLSGTFSYSPLTKPDHITQRLGSALAHVFNHQTHHRGQCHAILTTLGKPSLTLDLVYFLRAEGKAWL